MDFSPIDYKVCSIYTQPIVSSSHVDLHVPENTFHDYEGDCVGDLFALSSPRSFILFI